jgi:hypothetical protein
LNVQVKHNSVDISSYVISYEREHKICTGIGRLNVVLAINYPTNIDPWDSFDIWENGSFQVRYYVSDVVFSVPDATVTVECQDNSKRLVDYFIPDQYTVDYPSYTRYWIQKFLDEAGISYQFNTSSQGNLLSNFTSLGLTSGYDQIMQLLQLSGWYMYFDGNGVAVIGSLNKDLSSVSGTYNKTDILNIAKVSDDKMLRNRAVVWGAYNSLFQQYAFADLKTHTRWNYDHRDLRTMVISNSNIPNKASAVKIANILLKEFARITVEKHLTVVGASNRNLGDVVRVRSHVYNGTGMITTFGVSMGRDGLVTNLILDERCPRLYGFFDFGDYVYVGTYGSGIWRKHIKFDPTWYNFSTGLTNLNITDLHINNDIFGSIAASGEMYYNESSDSNWTPLTITGLMSSVEDQLEVGVDIISGVMGSGVMQTMFSGIMGRATIVDKQSNTIKFGVDTWSGLNYGDYFLQYSGLITSSGISQSGVNRGWIVEYNPFEGTTEDYPISVSGNFNILVLDLENDGLNDYVSVATIGVGLTGDAATQQYNYGQGSSEEYRNTGLVSWSAITGTPTQILVLLTSTFFNVSGIGMVDNVDDHEFFYVYKAGAGSTYRFQIRKFTTTNTSFVENSNTTVTLTAGKIPTPAGSGTFLLGQAVRISEEVYRFLVIDSGALQIATITHLGSEVYSQAYTTVTVPSGKTFKELRQNGDKVLVCYNGTGSGGSFDFEICTQLIDLATGTFTVGTVIYNTNGTSTNRKDLFYKPFNFRDSFQLVGWQQEWNSGTPTSRSNYELHGTPSAVSVGASSQFTSTGALANVFVPSNISKVWVNQHTSNGGVIYINYGSGVTANGVNINDIGGTPLYSSDYENKTFRVTGLYPTSSLEVNAAPHTTWTTITLPGNLKPISNVFFRIDLDNDAIYIRAKDTVTTTEYIIGLDPDDYTLLSQFVFSSSETNPSGANTMFNVGNMTAQVTENAIGSVGVEFRMFRNLTPPLGTASSYLILQREGFDYHVIQQAGKPLRVDISNSSPVLSVQDFENTFVSNYIYGDVLDQIVTFSGLTEREVRDYRYTLLESTVETETLPSGGVSQTILYVEASGVWGTSIEALASGFILLYTIPSGFAERIETSNYIPSGQYIFVTTSGNEPTFFQKDPEDFFFTEYDGLPNSRATIIRVDDRF